MKNFYLTRRENFNLTNTLIKVALIISMVFCFQKSYSQTSCSNAIAIAINGTCATGASVSDGTENSPNISGCSAGTFRKERWYTFSVSAPSQVVTITASSADRNLYLQLISATSSCSGLTTVDCENSDNNNSSAQTEILTATLTNGLYYIKVVSIGTSSFNMTLNSLCVTAPTNCTTPTTQPTSLVFSGTSATGVTGNFTAASPAPNKYLVVRSTSATAPSPGPVNGTTYTAGNTISGATVVSVGNTTSFTDSSLAGNTKYYYYVYSLNDTACTTVAYNTTSPLTNNVTTCPATPTSPVNSSITTTGATVSWTASAGGSANTVNYTLLVYTDAGYTTSITGSPFSVGTATTRNLTGLTAGTTYYYRIIANNGCNSGYLTGSVTTASLSCVTPTAQPSTLVLSAVTSTSLSGSFTAASPAPSGYLIVRSTSATAPTLTNGTTYAVGNTTLAPGTTLVIQGSAVTSNAVAFTDSGLTGNTKYYYHIFSYNNGCTGAPYYFTTSPLTNNTNTCPAAPTSAVNASITSTGFNVSWTASAGGTAATVNYTVEVYTNASYTTPITGSPFAVGTALNYSVSGLTPITTYYYRILANNGCSSSYLTGSVTTTLATCVAPSTAASALIIGTATSTSIPATFTGLADGYLVICSTSATPPTQPIDGTTYSSANVGTLGTGLIFMQSGNSTTIAGTGLTGNTRYYYYIYSYNSTACFGGPVYNTAGALTGNARTCPAVPQTVTTSDILQNGFTLNWGTPIGGSAHSITYTIQVTTDAGFTTDVLDSPFTVLDPINTLDITDIPGNTTYYYRILANNGCDSNYVTGSVTTLNVPCVAPNQAFNFTNGAVTSSTYPAAFLGSADGFLVIRSTSATPPTQPVDGTLYSAANIATLGTGLTFVQTGSSYNISSTGLNGNTKYYYYVFAYNSSVYCTGGPVYNTSGPLTANATTCPASPSGITTTGITTTAFTLNWTAPTGGGSNAITYTVQITTNPGYTANITGSPFTIADPTTTLSLSGLTSGTIYYYRILASNGCSSSYATGSVTTTITNNDCATAIALTVNTTSTCLVSATGTTSGATQSLSGCSGSADDDVWYKFVATATSHTVTVIPSTLNDIVFQVYKTACGGTSAGCIDSTGGTSTEAYTFTGLTIGTSYFVRVYSEGNGSAYQGIFSICITTPVAPINDNCGGALALTVNTTTSCVTSTTATTLNATQSLAGCSGTADDDVWFSFVAINASQKITVSPITINNPVFQIFSGTCAGLTSMQCNNATSGSAIEFNTLAGLTVGATYYVRVYSSGSGSSNNGSFSICVTTPCSPGSGNGTSSTTCPNIIAGASGLNGANPTPLTCYASNTCTNLEAIFPDYNETTSYTVTSIPYTPPYQFNCLANPISVNIDDVWSNTITLPFNFCFYGNTYNKVLIGSNGVITFDTTTYSPGGYSAWSFTNNLPSTSLFMNTIFGVYHDIDPSKGGEVGWELVTLSSGCRALVAAWSDIPMYSAVCNSALYTGMMVLHENSNIIDVFVKEKNVCSTWNTGNAVVGIQNSNGTQAIVAPNRNSTDTDWTVNQEAWRFTPSGASVATVKWYQGSGTSGTLVGTGTNVAVCPTATTNYTAEVTYNFCNGTVSKYTDEATVTISSGKTWTGAVDSDWSNAGNWSPSGVPTSVDCITIPNVTNKPVISGTSYDAYCYNLTLASGSSLIADSNNNITVTDYVKVNGTGSFSIKDSASLIQINNTATNTGSISMERTAYVKAYDYVYWCSPVKSFNSGSISPASPSGYVFKWNPTVANSNGGQGNWVGGTETMALAKGYIAISPGTYSYSVAAPLTATFNGIPYNGIRKPTISRGSFTGANYTGTNGATITNLDDNWNLIGNPYPSAIDALSFLTLNSNINGNIRLWTHGSPVSSSNTNPFYGSFSANYNVNDYISYNGTGSTPPGFNGKIGAGQAFFVIMNDGSASSSTVTFNNSLRSAAYNNSQFYKHTSTTTSAEPEKSRIWLSLVDATNMAATTLVGYVEGASYDYDRVFDASHKPATSLGIYSWIADKTVIINGRPTPFDDTDFVNLGATIPNDGNYKIGINELDGLFTDSSQDIFLEDTQLNVIHNLRTEPYAFAATAGNYENRFILRYRSSTLGNVEHNQSSTYAYVSHHILNVKSMETIKEIYLYDIAGKLVNTFKPETETNHFEIEFPYQNGVYLATVIKTDGTKVTVKLLN